MFRLLKVCINTLPSKFMKTLWKEAVQHNAVECQQWLEKCCYTETDKQELRITSSNDIVHHDKLYDRQLFCLLSRKRSAAVHSGKDGSYCNSAEHVTRARCLHVWKQVAQKIPLYGATAIAPTQPTAVQTGTLHDYLMLAAQFDHPSLFALMKEGAFMHHGSEIMKSTEPLLYEYWCKAVKYRCLATATYLLEHYGTLITPSLAARPGALVNIVGYFCHVFPYLETHFVSLVCDSVVLDEKVRFLRALFDVSILYPIRYAHRLVMLYPDILDTAENARTVVEGLFTDYTPMWQGTEDKVDLCEPASHARLFCNVVTLTRWIFLPYLQSLSKPLLMLFYSSTSSVRVLPLLLAWTDRILNECVQNDRQALFQYFYFTYYAQMKSGHAKADIVCTETTLSRYVDFVTLLPLQSRLRPGIVHILGWYYRQQCQNSQAHNGTSRQILAVVVHCPELVVYFAPILEKFAPCTKQDAEDALVTVLRTKILALRRLCMRYGKHASNFAAQIFACRL